MPSPLCSVNFLRDEGRLNTCKNPEKLERLEVTRNPHLPESGFRVRREEKLNTTEWNKGEKGELLPVKAKIL